MKNQWHLMKREHKHRNGEAAADQLRRLFMIIINNRLSHRRRAEGGAKLSGNDWRPTREILTDKYHQSANFEQWKSRRAWRPPK